MKKYIFVAIICTVQLGIQTKLFSQSTNIEALSWLPDNDRISAGAILVPENHNEPDGKKIQITYVIIKGQDNEKSNFPMTIFTGGPGGNTISEGIVNFLLKHPYTKERDVILFDQRGIGYSSALPDMAFDSFKIMAKNANEDEELVLNAEMIETYQKKCAEMDIDPRHYNSMQSAQDVAMLFNHLGYKKYNLYGSSYGTRLARIVQDTYPEYVNSSVLDSPDPITGDFLLDRLDSYSEALNKIFDYCKSTPECNKTYPKLKDEYFEGIARLRNNPIKTVVNDSIDFFINAQDGVYLLRRLLYRGDAKEKSPELIRAFAEGKGNVIKEIVEFEYMFTGILNLSMLISVERTENFLVNTTDEMIDNTYKSYPLIPTKMGFFDAFYRAGQKWHTNTLPMEDRYFKQSSVPTLIFVNKFDPVTPPENGHIFMKTLENGTLLILDEGGHGSGNADCKDAVMINFMDNPNQKIDTTCLNLVKD